MIHTFTIPIDLFGLDLFGVEITAEVEPGSAGVYTGPPDNWAPPDPGFASLVEARFYPGGFDLTPYIQRNADLLREVELAAYESWEDCRWEDPR